MKFYLSFIDISWHVNTAHLMYKYLLFFWNSVSAHIVGIYRHGIIFDNSEWRRRTDPRNDRQRRKSLLKTN